MNTSLSVHAQILRLYAEAVRAAFAPIIKKDGDEAQLAGLLLSLADATAECAEQLCETQQELEALARELGLRPPRPKLRLLDGGKS